jgi:aspartate/tyrosine/aromatic aminotransferase
MTSVYMKSIFKHVEKAAVDPILGTQLLYRADPSPHKVDLGIGAARDDKGKPILFKVVQEV